MILVLSKSMVESCLMGCTDSELGRHSGWPTL